MELIVTTFWNGPQVCLASGDEMKTQETELSFTSGIPEPHAYGAKALTSRTAKKEKSKAQKMYIR